MTRSVSPLGQLPEKLGAIVNEGPSVFVSERPGSMVESRPTTALNDGDGENSTGRAFAPLVDGPRLAHLLGLSDGLSLVNSDDPSLGCWLLMDGSRLAERLGFELSMSEVILGTMLVVELSGANVGDRDVEGYVVGIVLGFEVATVGRPLTNEVIETDGLALDTALDGGNEFGKLGINEGILVVLGASLIGTWLFVSSTVRLRDEVGSMLDLGMRVGTSDNTKVLGMPDDSGMPELELGFSTTILGLNVGAVLGERRELPRLGD